MKQLLPGHTVPWKRKDSLRGAQRRLDGACFFPDWPLWQIYWEKEVARLKGKKGK